VMLETIREYALERLAAADEVADLRRRHAEYWVGVAERAAEAPPGAAETAETRRLGRDHDNLRAGLDWAVRSGEAARGLRLAAGLRDYWRLGSRVREGVGWLTALLALPRAADRTPLRARAVLDAANLHGWIDDPETFVRLSEEALGLSRELDDPSRVAEALAVLGWAHVQTGRLATARDMLTEARDLHLDLGNRRAAADCMNGLGILSLLEGRLDDAREYGERALAMFQDLREPYWVGLTQFLVANVDRAVGAYAAAEQRGRAGLTAFRQIDNTMGLAWGLYGSADLALLRGDPERALRLAGASETLRDGSELPTLVMATMGDVRQRAREDVEEARADELYQEGLRMTLDEAVAYALREDA